MAVLQIRRAGDKVLKEVCRPVEKIDRRLKSLLDNMAETMYLADGVGLAAPQVGETVRVVVIDVGEGLLELINPVIVAHEGEETDAEGCLSVPELTGDVKRYKKVTVECLDRRGKKRKLVGEGLLARAMQHELDHLDGILFIDRAESLQRVEE